MAAVFTATYIGGSMKYVATTKAVGLDDSSWLTAGMAVDNLMMIFYFLVLFSLPSMHRLRSLFHERSAKPLQFAETNLHNKNSPAGERIILPNMAAELALSLMICTFAFEIEKIIPYKGTAIILITLISLILATLLRALMNRLKGALETGTLLMQIFFATIGASANIYVVIQTGLVLLVFAAIILLVHLLINLLVGKYAGLSLPEIVIASNANTGGPTTALAMASTRGWQHLMVPAVLCGTLVYATGNLIAIAIGNLLK